MFTARTGLPAERLSAGIEAATATLADLVARNDQDMRIPACPDWTLRQLATHVGRAHRWAAEIVGTRSAQFIEFRSVPDGKSPHGADGQASWLTAGAGRLIDAVRAAGDAQVWAFTTLAPASFWARRMVHETVVHLADVQLAAAAGEVVEIPADLAADAIDEWLTVMSPLNNGGNALTSILPAGAAIGVQVTGPECEWLVEHSADGVQVLPGPGGPDVTLAGPGSDVLLVLMRRMPVTSPSVLVSGDAAMLDRWLELTAF